MQARIPGMLLLTAALGWVAPLTTLADEEQELIALLQSPAGPVQKCEACKRLRIVGTPRSVPGLEPLLDDARTSQAARHVLEAIPGPEAGAALRRALARCSGPIKSGLIDSLGWRRDLEAVPSLVTCLADADAVIAASSATALSRIGAPDAIAALQAARETAPAGVRPAVLEGLLRCAEQRLAAGDRAQATRLYRSLLVPVESEQVRIAAYAGLIQAADDSGTALIISALKGDDATAQAAALAGAGSVPTPGATRQLAGLLSQVKADLQVAIIAALQERGDRAASAAVQASARSAEAAVREAALTALGTLGDASSVALLAEVAASDRPAERTAARQSLAILGGAGVTESLVAQLGAGSTATQAEVVRALTARREVAALPALVQLARTDTGAARKAALQALGQLADGRQVDALVLLLSEAKDTAARDEVRGVFESLVQRAGDAGELEVAPILQGLTTGSIETRQALLQISVLFADERLRGALRAALQDSDPRLHAAAERALCDARDPALLPDMLRVARETPDAALGSLALEGAVRLATEEGINLTVAQRIDALTEACRLASRVEEKRMVLAGLARVPQPATLALADQACADAAVRNEAELACLQIARRLGPADFTAVTKVLTRLARQAELAAVRTESQSLLKQLDSGWFCHGPYRQEGKECQQLFDVVFPPEAPGGIQGPWSRAPGSTDLARQGEVDLLGVAGGNHCVVYAKTRVFAPRSQEVSFAIGSDDGIKLWVNGDLVHANNAVRGLTPDQDRAKGRLREGWNDLLVKITQHTVGCGFTLRIVGADGAVIPGLRFEPEGQ